MTFSKSMFVGILAVSVLTACGGGDTPDSDAPENIVEIPELNTESSSNVEATPVAAPAETEATENPFSALPAPYNEANYSRGRSTFKLCQSCHTLTEGGPNLVGPNLYGLFGRQVGSVEGFSYSSAVQGADFTWSPEKLNEWLTSPRDFLPGNNMSFAGVRKPSDRDNVIAYIMLETGYAPVE